MTSTLVRCSSCQAEEWVTLWSEDNPEGSYELEKPCACGGLMSSATPKVCPQCGSEDYEPDPETYVLTD